MTALKDEVLCPDCSHVVELGSALYHVFSLQRQSPEKNDKLCVHCFRLWESVLVNMLD